MCHWNTSRFMHFKKTLNLVASPIEDGLEQWRKKNIFYLPYWESNLLRHNLDAMHIKKMYVITWYTKDNLKASKDLEEMSIRKDLWPNDNGRFHPSLFTMSNSKKDIFLRTLKNVPMPDGYSSNISRCIDLKNRKFFGMKVTIVIFLWINYCLLPYVMFY